MIVYSLSIIAAMAIILFLTGMYYSCKRGYIIPSRIDIQIEITPVPFKEIANTQQGESSATIRERVIRAREIQEQRFRDHKGIYFNSQMSERMIHQYAEPDDKSLDLLHMAMERLSLSARAYSRILKVARTIADLDASDKVQTHHIAEAINYRNLDRADWAERGI